MEQQQVLRTQMRLDIEHVIIPHKRLLDREVVSEVRRSLLEHVRKPQFLLVDLRNVTYVSRRAILAFRYVQTRIQNIDGRFALTYVEPCILAAIHIVVGIRAFTVEDSVEDVIRTSLVAAA